MEAITALTGKDLLDFFANSAVEKVALFAFFAIIFVLLWNTRKDRKDFTESCKSLELEISKLSVAIVTNAAADEEKDRRHMRELTNLNSALAILNSSLGRLQTDIARLHNYCMGRNGNPTQPGGNQI